MWLLQVEDVKVEFWMCNYGYRYLLIDISLANQSTLYKLKERDCCIFMSFFLCLRMEGKVEEKARSRLMMAFLLLHFHSSFDIHSPTKYSSFGLSRIGFRGGNDWDLNFQLQHFKILSLSSKTATKARPFQEFICYIITIKQTIR